MRALVKFSAEVGAMEVRRVPVPEVGPNDVLVSVKACGVDRGGDLYVWKSVPGMWFNIPVIVGAEQCGVVAAVGAEVTDWKPGDRVASEVIVGRYGGGKGSVDASYLFQEEKWDLGRNLDGAFAEYFVTPERFVHAIPDNVSFRAATLYEMAGVATRGVVEVVKVPAGKTVAVIGPGPVGNIAAQLVKAQGSHPVLLGMSSDDYRLTLARDMGIDDQLVVDDPSFAETLKARFPKGFEYVIEASGGANALPLAIDIVAAQGVIGLIGGRFGETPILTNKLIVKQAVIQPSVAHTWSTWELVAKLSGEGKLNLEPLYTGSYSLEDWEAAFKRVDVDMALTKIGICPGELL
jgi:threonine dehydrogenase-like Zn-dependent dehydrogenase